MPWWGYVLAAVAGAICLGGAVARALIEDSVWRAVNRSSLPCLAAEKVRDDFVKWLEVRRASRVRRAKRILLGLETPAPLDENAGIPTGT